MSTATLTSTSEQAARATAPTCDGCGDVLYNGACLNIGRCERADTLATRGASWTRSKYALPAAWNARGRVD